jgi:hypothetical protein
MRYETHLRYPEKDNNSAFFAASLLHSKRFSLV